MEPSLTETGNLPKMTVNRAGICGAAVPSRLFDVAIHPLASPHFNATPAQFTAGVR